MNFCCRISISVRDLDRISALAWEIPGVQGLEELPPGDAGLFLPDPEQEFLEFGSEAAIKAEAWIRKEAFKKSPRLDVKIYLERDVEVTAPEAEDLLRDTFGKIPFSVVSFEKLEAKDYLAEYRKTVRGQNVGETLWVGPPWDKAPEGRFAIVVEPGLAFGTGDHPTTLMCLERVEHHAKRGVGPVHILDLGTGSGVLSAACRHFFPNARIVATDTDPLCEFEVKKTFELSGLSLENVELRCGPSSDFAQLRKAGYIFDFVVSNIYAEVLTMLAPKLSALLFSGSLWVASGILEGKIEDTLLATAEQAQFRRAFRATQSRAFGSDRETWVCLEWKRS